MFGGGCLDDNAPSERPPAGASRDLRDELACPFGGAEVGEVERRVGVDDADEHDVGEVEPLGDHLRADEDLDLAGAEGVERPLVAAAGAHRVGVHPGDARPGEEPAHLLLELLRPGAALGQLRCPAARAIRRKAGDVPAAVADPAIARLMEREGQVALFAAGGVAAGPALDMGGEAAAVEEEHHLPPRGERPLDPGDEPRAQRAPRAAPLVAQVDGDHRRELRSADPVRETAHPP